MALINHDFLPGDPLLCEANRLVRSLVLNLQHSFRSKNFCTLILAKWTYAAIGDHPDRTFVQIQIRSKVSWTFSHVLPDLNLKVVIRLS